ncbi:hypothetical protein SAMN04487905_108129 [Actinopolyspora xinjiangensis]|uniref:Uncharacterized protein n=1 Tax=Actinopolyspora xinjiangensis TaxID=405564 RepID=A0A1H0VB19_9ACTN|nr:hypothetical protein SAMN04487905_108129 [Actinopolyspora xinjiangensis]
MTQRNVTHSRTIEPTPAHVVGTADRTCRAVLGEPVDTSAVPPETIPKAATASTPRSAVRNTTSTRRMLAVRLPDPGGRLPRHHFDSRGRHPGTGRRPVGTG